MDYFKGISDLDALKKHYRILCRQYHPDLGGDTRIMQIINAQYATALKNVFDHKGVKLDADGIKIEEDLMAVINKIVALKGLVIEVAGRWIWVTGNTYTHKGALKVLGFWWASKKCAWYWRPNDAAVKNHRPIPLEQIREKYGSISVPSINRAELA